MSPHDPNPNARATNPAIKTHRLFTVSDASIANLLSHSSNRQSPGLLKAALRYSLWVIQLSWGGGAV
jgi:hypothetical protein